MPLNETYPLYLANQPKQPNADLTVTNKTTGQAACRVAKADPSILDEAIAAADRAAEPMRRLKGYQRRGVLEHLVKRCEQEREALTEALIIEAGKPKQFATGEVGRLIDTLRVAAKLADDVAGHGGGEVLPLDVSERAAGYRGMWKRVPIGPCAFITPWNFPLNLVAHKIGPALAVGCPFVLKPASYTPVGALMLGAFLAETDLPDGAFSILPMASSDSVALVEDDRLQKLSFTGSQDVGWSLKAKAGKKKVTLELGGNAAVIIDEGVDLDDAVDRVVLGAFYQSGQSCISVQRILVHRAVYEPFRDRFVERTKSLVLGDPADEATYIGPVISEDDAQRLIDWVNEADEDGGVVLCGGKRDGVMVQPTIVQNVPHDAKLYRDEVFGPVAGIEAFSDFDEALALVNDSDFGLQAGVFTPRIDHAMKAWDELVVGGVMINDVPSWRVDHMPYGGVKDSGLGREGLRFAMQDMTEPRLLVIRDVPPPR